MKNLLNSLFCGITFLWSIQAISAASESSKFQTQLLSVAENNSILWKSGNCGWLEKQYVGLPLDFFESIQNGTFKNQVPSTEKSEQQIDPKKDFSLIVDYLDRFVPPASCSYKDLAFNPEGWRLDVYSDTLLLAKEQNDILYRNPKFGRQGMASTIRFGDKQWERLPRAAKFDTSQGIQTEPHGVPIPFGDIYTGFFLHNLFTPRDGASFEVEYLKPADSYKIRFTANQGITVFDIQNLGGSLVVNRDETSVNGKLIKLKGEFGRLDVIGKLATPGLSVSKFSVEIDLMQSTNKVNIVVKKVEFYKCEEISNELLMSHLAE